MAAIDQYYLPASSPGSTTGGRWGTLGRKFRRNVPQQRQRRPLYDYSNPLGNFTQMFSGYGGVNDLFDPTGRAYSDPIEQLLRMEGAGRARGAALRASRSTIPGMRGFAALQSDLSSASDLARGLGEARAAGVEASQRFRGGLLGNLMNYGYQAERGERQYEQQGQLQKNEYEYNRKLEKQRKRGNSTLGFGPMSITF